MLCKGIRFILSGLVIALTAACTAAPGGSEGGGNTSSSAPLILDPGVYVAANGNDANSGTNAAAPLKTIQLALSNAAANGLTNIYVAQGVFKPGSGLNSISNGVLITNDNINLIGGFSGGFSIRNGRSELNGTNGLYHILKIYAASNVKIDGFILENGNANDTVTEYDGGGLYVEYSSYCLITNTVISNNYAEAFGGGAALLSGSFYAVFAIISGNTCRTNGGGIFMGSCVSNIINSYIQGNQALFGNGGGILMNNGCSRNLISGSIISNHADNVMGGGIYDNGSFNMISNALVGYNTSYHGAGITLFGSQNSLITGSIIEVNAAFPAGGNGGGIYCVGQNILITNSIFIANTAYNGGGFCFNTVTGILADNLIIENSAPNSAYGYGGGLYIESSPLLITGNRIISNYAGASGGGMIVLNSSALISYNSILSNFGGSWGDGAYFTNSPATNLGNIFRENNNNAIGVYQCPPEFVLISNTIGTARAGGWAFCKFSEISNFIMQYNIFITNKMLMLLLDDENVNLSVTNGGDWVNINNTNRTLAEPGSTNNSATNM